MGRLDIKVEMSGGIRDQDSLHRALSTSCRPVNVGTAALEKSRVDLHRDRDPMATASPPGSTCRVRRWPRADGRPRGGNPGRHWPG